MSNYVYTVKQIRHVENGVVLLQATSTDPSTLPGVYAVALINGVIHARQDWGNGRRISKRAYTLREALTTAYYQAIKGQAS